jgi:hypothetical protein
MDIILTLYVLGFELKAVGIEKEPTKNQADNG